MRSDWNFDTIKTVSALGSIRGTLHELSMPPGMVPEEADEEDLSDDGLPQDSSVSTRGSDPIVPNGVGAMIHSTVIIKSSRIQQEARTDETPPGKGIIQSTQFPLTL
jgi:serine/threonine-protein kinase 24/25/MST4